jgi:hypothetical protein
MVSWNMRQGVAKLEGRVNVSHNTLPNHPVERTAHNVRVFANAQLCFLWAAAHRGRSAARR